MSFFDIFLPGLYQKENMEQPRNKGIKPVEHKKEQERCILVGIATPKIRPWLAGEQLAELGRLAETAGAFVTRSFLQRVQNFSPATLIGEGKVNEVKRALEEDNAKMVVFDDDLSHKCATSKNACPASRFSTAQDLFLTSLQNTPSLQKAA